MHVYDKRTSVQTARYSFFIYFEHELCVLKMLQLRRERQHINDQDMFTFRVYVHKANTSSSKSKQKPKHGKGNVGNEVHVLCLSEMR